MQTDPPSERLSPAPLGHRQQDVGRAQPEARGRITRPPSEAGGFTARASPADHRAGLPTEQTAHRRRRIRKGGSDGFHGSGRAGVKWPELTGRLSTFLQNDGRRSPRQTPRDGAEAAQRTPGSPGSEFTRATQEDRLSTRAGSGPSESAARRPGASPGGCAVRLLASDRLPEPGRELLGRARAQEGAGAQGEGLRGRSVGRPLWPLFRGPGRDAGLCRECARALPPSAIRPALSRALTLAHQTSGWRQWVCVEHNGAVCPRSSPHPGPRSWDSRS